MKVLNYSLSAAAGAVILAAGIQAASAASLGAVEYARFTNSASVTTNDLGGVRADIADALITLNEYDGAATLPGGLPNNYSIHIDRTFTGDGNPTTADELKDRYWFKIDPATMGGGASSWADASLTIVTGYDTGMDGVAFTLFEADETGAWVGGPAAIIYGEGHISLAGFNPDHSYMMKVVGNLRTEPNSTNVGRYDIVLGLTPLAPIPVPPSLLLLLTGLGAMFGFGRMRKTA